MIRNKSGRWQNNERDQRLCNLYFKTVGDEFH